MNTALKYHHQYLIPAFCAVFILLIGFKSFAPALKKQKGITKQVSMTTEQDDSEKSEKKAENDIQDKKEYIRTHTDLMGGALALIRLKPAVHYGVSYISNHYYQIIAPPPDFSLHT